VPAGRLGISVQADTDPDSRVPEHGEHSLIEQGAVGLQRDIDLSGHAGAQHVDQVG
jgi:hypothetical protein